MANLLQDGNPFPSNYFWDCEKVKSLIEEKPSRSRFVRSFVEKEHLEFHEAKVININRKRAVILLIGIFIFRALVTTVDELLPILLVLTSSSAVDQTDQVSIDSRPVIGESSGESEGVGVGDSVRRSSNGRTEKSNARKLRHVSDGSIERKCF